MPARSVPAALDLGKELLVGLAGVDWATISYNLGVALGNLVTAISDWFSVSENTTELLQAGAQIVDGIFEGFWKRYWEVYETMFPGPMARQEYLINPPVLIDPTVSVDTERYQNNVNDAMSDAVNLTIEDADGGSATVKLDVLAVPTVEVDETVIETETQSAIDTASTTLSAGEGDVEAAAQGVADAAAAPFEGLPEETRAQAALMLTSVNAAIEEGTPEALAAIDLAATAVLTKAREILSSPAGIAVGSVFMIGVMTGALSIQGALVSAVQGIGTMGVNAIASVMNSGTGYGIGQSMIQAVISGAGSMGSALRSTMYSLASSAVAAFKSAIRMASPPAAFVEIGEAIPDAVGLGTDANRDARHTPDAGHGAGHGERVSRELRP